MTKELTADQSVNYPVLYYYREQPGNHQGVIRDLQGSHHVFIVEQTRTHFFGPPVIYHQAIWAIYANVNNQFGLFTTHCFTKSTYFIVKS